MKSRFIVSAAVLVAAAAALLAGRNLVAQTDTNATAPASTAVAICNVAEVMQSYAKTSALMVELQQMKDSFVADEKQQLENIKAIRSELGELNQQSEVYSKRVEDYDRANVELRIFRETSETRLSRAHGQMTVQLLGDITSACETLAKQKGFTVVINSAFSVDPTTPEDIVMSPKVLFASGSVNLTGEVIEYLNATYSNPGNN